MFTPAPSIIACFLCLRICPYWLGKIRTKYFQGMLFLLSLSRTHWECPVLVPWIALNTGLGEDSSHSFGLIASDSGLYILRTPSQKLCPRQRQQPLWKLIFTCHGLHACIRTYMEIESRLWDTKKVSETQPSGICRTLWEVIKVKEAIGWGPNPRGLWLYKRRRW